MTSLNKLLPYYYILLLLLFVQCTNTNPQLTSELIKIPVSDNIATQTDFLSYNMPEKLLLYKNKYRNRIELFDFKKSERVSSIYAQHHLYSYMQIQSATYLNQDTILVLFKNVPNLYFCDSYGHFYDKWKLKDEHMTHFSITNNQPVINKHKLYIPILPDFESDSSLLSSKKIATELIVDLGTRKTKEIQLTTKRRDQNTKLGLRHEIATRSFTNNKLTYIWGSGETVQLDLKSEEVLTLPLNTEKLSLKSFKDDQIANDAQHSYYFKNEIYDHISFDKTNKIFYITKLKSSSMYENNYERDFTIYIYSNNFKLLKKLNYKGKKYLYNQTLLTEEGLFLSMNNPLSNISYDTLIFQKIDFHEAVEN